MTTPKPPTNLEIDKILETEKALAWARNPSTTGYSESWLNGYEKAYEQVKNDIPKIQALIDEAVKAELEDIVKGTINPEQAGVKVQHRLMELTNQLKGGSK